MYQSPLFKTLTPAQETAFREYARTNPPRYESWDVLHPVCRDEWRQRGKAPIGSTPDADEAQAARVRLGDEPA